MPRRARCREPAELAFTAAEVERLRDGTEGLTARNRFRGIVRSVEVDGLLARVEIDVADRARVVAIVTRESVEDSASQPG